MKKVALTIAMIAFGVSSVAHAAPQEEDTFIVMDCIGLAHDIDTAMGGISYELFDAIVQNCESAQN